MSEDVKDIDVSKLSDEELATKFKELTTNEGESTSEEEIWDEKDGQQEKSEGNESSHDNEPDGGEEQSIEDRLKALEEANNKLNKRLKDKDSFIERRNAEIGQLRKAMRERELESLPDDIDIDSDEFYDDPKKAVQKIIEAKQKKADLLEKMKNEQHQQQVERIKGLISEVAPNFDENVSDIVKLLKADKAPDNIIEQFESKPYESFNPAVTLQLIKRVELQKKVAELEAKLEEAQKISGKIINNVNKYSKSKSRVTSSVPTKGKTVFDGLTQKDIMKMSDEELAKLEAQL